MNFLILVDQSESSLHNLSLELTKNSSTEVISIVGDIKDKKFISKRL